eukprot:143701-Amphidinium_carterae.1
MHHVELRHHPDMIDEAPVAKDNRPSSQPIQTRVLNSSITTHNTGQFVLLGHEPRLQLDDEGPAKDAVEGRFADTSLTTSETERHDFVHLVPLPAAQLNLPGDDG